MKDTNKKDKLASLITVICVLALIVTSCCGYILLGTFKPEMKESFENYLSTIGNGENKKPEGTESYTARLMCAGDNIIHNYIYEQAASRSENGGYDFSYAYDAIKSIISESDIAMINQETIISDTIAPSSYPNFCSPAEIGDAITDLGFSVVNHANKHVGDKGSEGASHTYNYWTSKTGVLLTGLYQSKEEVTQIPTKEVNGITFSFIGVTEHINNALSSDGMPYVICLNEEGKTTADVYNELKDIIKKAEAVSDVVVMYVNYDNNEQPAPTTSQQDIANYLVSFGADVVIGSGTYTAQTMEIKDKADGSKAVVAYSLGNFISGQNAKENMLGAIADIIFTKDGETGDVTIASAKLIPIVTMYEANTANVRVLPLSIINEETISTHGIRDINLEYIETYFAENIGEENLEKTVFDTDTILGEIEEDTTAEQ